MLERSFHSLINLLDSALPTQLKREIKRVSPDFVDWVYRQVTRFTSDTIVKIRIQEGPLGGRPFFCSLRHQRSCYLGNFEPFKAAVLAEHLSPGKIFFDVGGHIGYFSLIAASLVRPHGVVVAFEPVNENVTQFLENLRVNPDLAALIRLEHAAVSDKVGLAAFEIGSNSYIGHLAPSGSSADIQVESTTLDAYAAASGLQPDFVKIDAEGAESLILQGMKQILERSRPHLLVEVHDPESHAAFLGTLKRYAYLSLRIEREHTLQAEPGWDGEAEYLAVPQ